MTCCPPLPSRQMTEYSVGITSTLTALEMAIRSLKQFEQNVGVFQEYITGT
jgi:hypothetical protein